MQRLGQVSGCVLLEALDVVPICVHGYPSHILPLAPFSVNGPRIELGV